jgi:hypothetical protein
MQLTWVTFLDLPRCSRTRLNTGEGQRNCGVTHLRFRCSNDNVTCSWVKSCYERSTQFALLFKPQNITSKIRNSGPIFRVFSNGQGIKSYQKHILPSVFSFFPAPSLKHTTVQRCLHQEGRAFQNFTSLFELGQWIPWMR